MLLAIDTATRLLGVALTDGDMILAEHVWQTANQHSVELSPALQRLFHQAGITPSQLTAVAVAQGPGSFTGLRIGMSVAKGLALALDIPVLGIPTLDVVAAGTPYFDGHLMAVIQAGRGRIIWGQYEWVESGWRLHGELDIAHWEHLITLIQAPTLINGEIDTAGLAILQQNTELIYLLPPPLRVRRPSWMAELAWQQLRRGEVENTPALTPIYLKTLGVS